MERCFRSCGVSLFPAWCCCCCCFCCFFCIQSSFCLMSSHSEGCFRRSKPMRLRAYTRGLCSMQPTVNFKTRSRTGQMSLPNTPSPCSRGSSRRPSSTSMNCCFLRPVSDRSRSASRVDRKAAMNSAVGREADRASGWFEGAADVVGEEALLVEDSPSSSSSCLFSLSFSWIDVGLAKAPQALSSAHERSFSERFSFRHPSISRS
mmetsp:Transcript_4533/g.10753  ORF Transcript_4533/g.10753 Transcript_4533/m.10753 type:complete len:205 (-) Transcript_4533:1513-2127(-)